MFLKRSLLVGAVALSLFSCSKDGGSILGKDKNATPGEYIEAYNMLIKEPRTLTDEYFGKFNSKELDVTIKRPRLFPRHNSVKNKTPKIHELVAAGKKANGSVPIVPFADSAVLAMDSIVAIFENAYNYYDSKEFSTDAWEKGKKFHASMMEYDALLSRSIRNMSAILQKEEQARDKKELEKHKNKDGFGYRYRSYNVAMKSFHNVLGSEAEAEALVELKAETEKLVAFVEKNKSHKFFSILDGYKGFAQDYTNKAKEIEITKKNGGDISELYGDLTSRYNTVIDYTNSIAEVEAQGFIK